MAGASAVAGRELALFDLDGTLTRHDTLARYLSGFLREHPQRWRRIPGALPSLARYMLAKSDRGQLKSAWIAAILGGSTRAALAEWTGRFVPRLLACGLFGDAVDVLDGHRRAGDYLVLLSASPDLYVPEIGRALGFAQTLCTGVEWVGERLTGKLTTANRRGVEKARCLAGLRSQHPQLPIVAYANATSDLAHLALADRGVLVNGSHRTRGQAARLGLNCVTWR